MLFINKKYKPMITKETENKEHVPLDYNTNIQGKGLNELIEKVKDIKVIELTKKRKSNSNSKISFN
jgi:hypothetical protein